MTYRFLLQSGLTILIYVLDNLLGLFDLLLIFCCLFYLFLVFGCRVLFLVAINLFLFLTVVFLVWRLLILIR
jgi:hypothetical protein